MNAPPEQPFRPVSSPQARTVQSAADCVTAPADAPEVRTWHHQQADAVAEQLPNVRACFRGQNSVSHVQLELEKAADGKPVVRVTGTTLSDCAVTQCLSLGLSNTALPDPPAALPADASRVAQVVVSFDPKGNPPLQLGTTPDQPLSPDSACVDQSKLPTSGRLSPVHIQSVFRGAARTMRDCYEQGLAVNPDLSGKVVTRFVIGLDGSVKSSLIASNSLPDCKVVTCIKETVQNLHFDKPTGGVVTVVYPLILDSK